MIAALPTRLLIPSLLVALGSFALAGESPYYPERGRAAIGQRALDLRKPAVVLSVALEPGEEDLPLVAWLRMGLGAKVVSVYVTGGSTTGSDLNGESPSRVAGCRKEEAYRVNTLLGAESYFLNLPDVGIVNRREALERLWVPDSVLAKLATLILSYRPDAILVHRDFRGEKGMTPRQAWFVDLLLRSIRAARSPLPAQLDRGMSAWDVQRVFADTGAGGYRVNGSLRNRVWGKTYASIGSGAGRLYESLRVRRREWEGTARSYALIFTASKKDRPASLLAGVPAMNPRIRSLAALVSRACDQAERSSLVSAVASVAAAIDSVEHALYREPGALGGTGERVLAAWKNGLEDLRCSLFDLRIAVTSSDSLVTADQVFFLRFSAISGAVDTSRTQVLFPLAMKHVWGIDESVNYKFNLSVPREFRVITPDKPEYNMPVSTFGQDRPRPRTQFPFIIYHNDAVRARNYAYRKEIPLGMGPVRTLEVLTPVVRLADGERVVFSVMNFSRDAFEGDVYIQDSLVTSPRRRIRLSHKDEVLTDTLTIACSPGAAPGDRPVRLFIAGKPLAQVTARKFDAIADTALPVGLVTGIKGSPVAMALARLRVPVVLIGPGVSAGLAGLPFRTIIIDEEAAAQREDFAVILGALRSWTENGGNLVVLPQFLTPHALDSAWGGAVFRRWPALEPAEGVVPEEGSALLDAPNRIPGADWDGWVVSRSLGSVDPSGAQAAPVLRSSLTGEPLVVTLPEGRGRVTLVALDIVSQLRNVHPGAHRLLANLIAARLAR
jgi:hypothetical protein